MFYCVNHTYSLIFYHSLVRYMDKHKLKQDTRAFQLLAKLLHMDPKKRLSAQGALEDPYFTEVCLIYCVALIE